MDFDNDDEVALDSNIKETRQLDWCDRHFITISNKPLIMVIQVFICYEPPLNVTRKKRLW